MVAFSVVRCCFAFSLILFVTAPTPAQRRTDQITGSSLPSMTGIGGISGRVLLASGKAVGTRFRVTARSLQNGGQTSLLQTYTDDSGEFTLNNLPEDVYSVEVRGDDKVYAPIHEQVYVVRGRKTTVTMYLREKATSAPGPGSPVVSVAELSQEIPKGAKKEFEQASHWLKKGEQVRAIEHLQAALAIFPDYLMALNDLGVQYLKLNRLDEAVEQFERAVSVNPKVFNPRLNLGITFMAQKKYPDASEQLTGAISMNSAEPAPHFYLGLAYLKMNKPDLAEESLLKALSMGGDRYSAARYYLAHIYLNRGEKDKAIKELEAYLEKHSSGDLANSARALLKAVNRE